jgi:hypothetical protein
VVKESSGFKVQRFDKEKIMKRLIASMLMLCTMSFLPACGGGGGGAAPASAPTTAIVNILTSGTLASGALIGGIDVTLNLPAGVSVKATPDGANPDVLVTDSGVVAVSGVAAGTNTTAIGTYTASPNSVAIHVVNADGFGTGEFVTITCDIAAGTSPAPSDFTVSAAAVKDLNGAAVSGMTAALNVTLK